MKIYSKAASFMFILLLFLVEKENDHELVTESKVMTLFWYDAPATHNNHYQPGYCQAPE